jgi:hypothetical protein
MTFDPLSSPVNYALLAGVRTPGICEVVGADSPRKIDVRRSYAMGGATAVYRGIDLSRPTLMLRLYTEQDWQDWAAFAPLVLRELPPDAARVAQQTQQIEAARAERDGLARMIAIDPAVLGNDPATQRRIRRASRRADQQPGIAQRRARALDIWHPILEDLGIRSVLVENVLQPKQTGNGEWTIEIKLVEYRAPVFALARPEGSQEGPRDRFEAIIEQQSAANQALRDRLR